MLPGLPGQLEALLLHERVIRLTCVMCTSFHAMVHDAYAKSSSSSSSSSSSYFLIPCQ